MPTLQVRNLPEHIYRKIVERAAAERRSIAQETIVLLEKGLELGERSKEDRQALIEQILQQPPLIKDANVPDPVMLVREDRDR